MLKSLSLEAKMRKVPTSKFPFYVYDIIDPRTKHVFYVGCGRGNRIRTTVSQHPSASYEKRAALKSIARAGLKPVVKIVMCFAERSEALAFEHERQIRFRLISRTGKPL